MWRKGNPNTLLVGMYIGSVIVENSMKVLQKINTGSTLGSSNLAFSAYPKKMRTGYWKDICAIKYNIILYYMQLYIIAKICK